MNIGSAEITRSYRVTVYAPLPIPVIFIYTLQSSSSSERSSRIFLCSVVNVEYHDKNIYSCVVNNPIRNQTRHLSNTELYWLGSDSVHCCGTAEAVIRLVVTALMSVAAVAAIVVLVYDIKSRTEEKRTNINLGHRSDKI
ncbi:uncharacterized protein LOC127986837 isoform X3 [Carassius gibelio]|uniref:uncharacterized protein LOC127986837 isoform X3 n=1 Tax=Carassius gibelio TaxID=101364 RepID=UPI0022797F39|nr:uncharacterized protein LOC127986837 isoform X3 [Carassius gibelio]